MKRWTAILAPLVMFALFVGCSGGGSSPVLPTTDGDMSLTGGRGASTQTHCWGIFEVAINTTDGTVEVAPLRHAQFAANVETFIKTKNIKIALGTIVTDPGGLYMDIPVQVTLIHPFPGLDEYNGFDVRGIFMANGGGTVDGLPVAEWGADDGFLRNADGYSRWWNPTEFTVPGVLGYRPAALTTPAGFTGDAYVNPYCYYADALGVTDPNPDIGVNESLWDFVQTKPDTRGLFTAGAQNTRFYDLRFWGSAPWVFFTYAVLACWEEPDPIPPTSVDDFPETANSEEAIACSVDVTPSIYDTGTEQGGDLILDINVWDWSWPSTASGEKFEEVQLIIESSVLTTAYAATGGDEVGGGENYSTWHVEIPADNINGATTEDWDEEFWVIVKYPNLDYQNDYGVVQGTGDDPLTAYFRFPLTVYSEAFCKNLVPGVDTLNGSTNYVAGAGPYTGWTVEGSDFEEGTGLEVAVNDGTSDLATSSSVTWLDENNLEFDIDVSSVPGGTYDIVVTNGCGAMHSGVGDDLLSILKLIDVVGDPNIDVTTGYGAPTEIGCNPVADQVCIAYRQVSANRHVRWDSTYTSSTIINADPLFGNSNWPNPEVGVTDGCDDGGGSINAQGAGIIFSVMAYGSGYNDSHLAQMDWNGNQGCPAGAGYVGYLFWRGSPYRRIFTMCNCIDDDGDYAMIYHWCESDWSSWDAINETRVYNAVPYTNYIREISWPYSTSSGWMGGSGTNGVSLMNVRGTCMDPGPNTERMQWILEALPSTQTAVVELWDINEYPYPGPAPAGSSGPTYGGISFGEDFLSNQTKDITSDSNGFVYVLQLNGTSGLPEIWGYDLNGNLVGYSGELDASVCSGTALKVDCHLFTDPDEVHLLHSNGVTRFAMP